MSANQQGTSGAIEPTAPGQLYEVELLTLFRPRYVRWDERVHEGLEVGPPPLRKGVANDPFVVDTFTRELSAHWCKSFVQPELES